MMQIKEGDKIGRNILRPESGYHKVDLSEINKDYIRVRNW